MTQNPHGAAAEDLRVRRTRKLLQQALIDLTIEKGFVNVTVRDIAERAMVNRATFYRHYLDKYDLLDQYMEEVYRLTFGEDETTGEEFSPAGLVEMLEHVRKVADFFRVMLGKQGDPAFTHKVQGYIEKRFRTFMGNIAAGKGPESPPLDLFLRYVSYAGVGAIAWWLENDQPCSTEQLAGWLQQITTAELVIYTS